jgi:serine protease Do
VGINSQIFSRSGGFQGQSFAIPNLATQVKDQVVATGHASNARLGVANQRAGRLAPGKGRGTARAPGRCER